jgi:hypothetical protein
MHAIRMAIRFADANMEASKEKKGKSSKSPS